MGSFGIQYHLKIIFDGLKNILRTMLLEFLFIITGLCTLLYGLWHLPKIKIKWSLKFSLKRFLEFLAVFVNAFLLLCLYNIIAITMISLLFYLNNYGRIALVSYWIYIYHYHSTTLSLFERVSPTKLRNNILSNYLSSYYPNELIKTVDLEPNRNYVFAIFPHGVMCFGANNNMLFNIGKWQRLFPRIRPIMSTLDLNFFMPIHRNVAHAFGMISVSKDSLLHYLRQTNDPEHPVNNDGYTSNAVGVVVGGAQEAKYSNPGQCILTLKNRKGFVKIAIMSGASIVPSYTFGEVELYEQVVSKPGSFLSLYQDSFKKFFGVWPMLLNGRGFFQENFGLLPRRKRLVQVVGAPIDVIQSDKPDPKYVDNIHKRFIEDITNLFETHKKYYLDNYENRKLKIN